ncbi:hypothetical protein BDZ97DRAFT_1825834 [Flammula alnicola]|nr:hypothetical protein BDZ97DRAFT_1849518 [Flammula alnicola]KAF8962176.1 hypothetical protein BDZ97DRAFT_1825834 [Flammula alnicola]
MLIPEEDQARSGARKMSPVSPHLAFAGLGEDVLICIVSFLEPPHILRLAQTCKRLQELTSLRIVWTNACTFHVLDRGFPFPSTALDDLSTPDLIQHTKTGYRLAQRWLSGMSAPRTVRYIAGTSGTSVSDVRFVPGHDGRLLVTISKSVWSAMSIWDMGLSPLDESRKVCEWSPRGAIFTGFSMNCDPRSEATVAVSLYLNEQLFVKVLTLRREPDSTYSLEEMYSVDTTMKPTTLVGDLIALTDDVSQTAIWNWRDGTSAVLEHSIDSPSILQSNECIQVLFAHQSILVARARSIHLFPFPILERPDPDSDPPPPSKPLAEHSFGWVDGECVTICPFLESTAFARHPSPSSWLPLSILVRGESDDPWASDIYNLELYTLEPNPSYGAQVSTEDSGTKDETDPPSAIPPYLFPPRLSNQVACLRGSLRCKQITLGRFGTAIWIQPRDTFIGGLLADIPATMIPSSNACETLVMAVFPGSLFNRDPARGGGGSELGSVVIGKKIFGNEAGSSWTSFDYDEVAGRVAVGSSFGRVTVLEL